MINDKALLSAWLVVCIAGALNVMSMIGETLYIGVCALAIGYLGGRLHAQCRMAKQAREQMVQVLSSAVSDMGSMLASGELSEDQQAMLQHQRSDAMSILAAIERPSLRERVHDKLSRSNLQG
jgi:hypothetical protein